MVISEEKKYEVWNHFVARWVIDKIGPYYMTGHKLKKLKIEIWDDSFFWDDVVLRHRLID